MVLADAPMSWPEAIVCMVFILCITAVALAAMWILRN